MPKFLLLLISTVFCGLILVLNFNCNMYIRPISDDFWRDCNSISFHEYLVKIKNWYLVHNGRYANSVLSLIPFFYKLIVYRLTSILIQLAFIYSIKKVIDHFLGYRRSLLIAIVFFAFYLAFCPAYYESFLWFASSNHYMLGLVLITLLFSLILKVENFETVNYRTVTSIAVLIVILIGSNEIWILLIPYMMFLLLVRQFINGNKLVRKVYIWLFVLALVCMVFSYISPANDIRSDLSPDGKKLIPSIIWSFKGFFVELFHATMGVFSPLCIVLQFILWLFFSTVINLKEGKLNNVIMESLYKNKVYILSGIIGAILITLFTVKFGQSYRTLGIGRVRNVRFLLILLLLAYTSLLSAYYFNKFYKDKITSISLFFNCFNISISASLLIYLSINVVNVQHAGKISNETSVIGRNTFELMYDFKHERWQKYNTQWNDRIAIANISKGKDLVFNPMVEMPLTLENKVSSYELRTDSASHFNRGFAFKYGLKSVRVSTQ